MKNIQCMQHSAITKMKQQQTNSQEISENQHIFKHGQETHKQQEYRQS